MPVDLASLPKEERLYRMRHSAAHIMADVVLEMFPEGKFGIGPPIEWGFYYDFDLPRTLTPEDLEEVERRMRERMAEHLDFVQSEVPAEEALDLFKDQPYKQELIRDIGEPTVGLYRHGRFTDLCQGPHVNNTAEIPPFKLMSVAGAYWRGDEHRPQLQRIYGALFETQEELDEHMRMLEEAERRDHRRLGRELDLFSIQEEAGAGLIYWHPKGGRLRVAIEDLWRKRHLSSGYDIVFSPHIGKAWLWETSGHLGFYAENMYSPIDIEGQQYYLKPMNCPFHIMIYKNSLHSYRELPLRYAELGTVYRYERSGVLHGLLRVRGFTQDDAHIFCRPDQLVAEVSEVVDFSIEMLRRFGFEEFEAYVATRPEKAVGSEDQWRDATDALRQAMDAKGLPYEIDEGGGAFYGPKIDLKVKDALGRSWQLSTIQFDFNEPQRFGLTYIGEDGREHQPYMVHRALLGSIERFVGVLIEHYGGAFPLWLAPVQAKVIPIADRHNDYAFQVAERLKREGFRAEVDEKGDRMNQKIRNAQLEKVPYMLVVGDKEIEAGAAAVRLRSGENLGPLPLDEVVERMRSELPED